jgi:probable DNA repair protein
VGDTLYLCATTRLAQTLRLAGAGDSDVWQTPWALTLGQWLAGIADEALLSGAADLPALLDPFAESLLWEKVVATSLSEASPLFDIQGMAKSAAEAHALARVWAVKTEGYELSDEGRLFSGWQQAFQTHCRKNGWIDTAAWQALLIDVIEAGQCALPQQIWLCGFDRHTALELRLFSALQARGVIVEKWQKTSVHRSISEPKVFPCPDSAAECAAVAAWAKQHLQDHPGCRLGIVVPDLAGVRDRLEFMLDDILHPAFIRPDAAELPRCFNFSLGKSLADQPLIAVGLELLALGGGRGKLEQSRLSALLLNIGWSAAEAEADGRARLDAAMRKNLPYFTSLPALVRLVEWLPAEQVPDCPRSIAALAAFVETMATENKRSLPGAWAKIFDHALKAAGWPGDRQLSSHEFQACRAFSEVLDGFGRFDALLGPLNLSEAVRRLSQLCRQRIFQPETRGQPAIQVLGVLESAGLSFDALWVMGMNDDRWPPAPRPNPLLPAEALRQAGAAHASAEIELAFARQVHARLLLAAPDLCFSYALAEGNRVLRPSPLITGMPRLAVASPKANTLAMDMAQSAAGDLEQVEDHLAPPVAAGEKVAGGSGVLRAQAICPAWAYYQYRLGAVPVETPVEGLDPAARGTLVHAVLESFWKTVLDSDTLLAMSPAGRQAQIATAVSEGIASFEHDRRITLPVRFRQLEASRLASLLDLWLAIESKRDAAFSVVACEELATLEIEGIKVNLVIDRIDQLADGRQIIIDYKTGARIDTKNWAGQRITEPQLPIYAALVAEEVAAVVFAKVLLDKPGFAGVADEKNILPGVQGVGDEKQKLFDPAEFPDWIAVVTHWRERLHAIASEIKRGEAGVSYAEEKDLQYCEVKPLLRLAERRRLLATALAAERAVSLQ